jgi:hypothetical protein
MTSSEMWRRVILVAAATFSSWFLARGFFYPEDGGDMFLRNILHSHRRENVRSYKPDLLQKIM